MKHDFSAQYLRITPPDLNFGEAWESLCFDLLRVELDDPSLIRLCPPDKGVDVLSRSRAEAYSVQE